MAQSGGEAVATKRAKLSGDANDADAGADGLSALPDDVLVLILVRLASAAAAGRTSVLSRRWRRVWALLPELRFVPAAPPPHLITSALASHEATLRHLLVGVDDAAAAAAPESAVAWLPVAARRLSVRLTIQSRVKDGGDAGEKGGAFQLLCFERAAIISLDLGFLGLALPPAGVFAQLTGLTLRRVRFHGACQLGDAVSSPRCPLLKKLSVCDACGVTNLAIRSESLLEFQLWNLNGLRRLTVAAPALKELKLASCFARNRRPVAEISAPQLVVLTWMDQYDQNSVKFGNLVRLKKLTAYYLCVYGQHGYESTRNHALTWLLGQSKVVPNLQINIMLTYPTYIGGSQYLMKDFTVPPRLKKLVLFLHNKGHAFGASLFHVLSMCTGLEKLGLSLYPKSELEVQCPSGCVCDQPSNWKTKELTLNCLRDVVIIDLEGTDHEIAFMKRLFNWATALKRMGLVYRSISLSKAEEVREKLLNYAMPETCISLMKYLCGE